MSYIWDYAADDRQYIDLYRTLKTVLMKRTFSVIKPLRFLRTSEKICHKIFIFISYTLCIPTNNPN